MIKKNSEENKRKIEIFHLKANTDPVIEFALCPDEKLQEVYAYCNLHGLWMTKAQ